MKHLRLALVALAGMVSAWGADHRDGPVLLPDLVRASDIAGIYVFRSPANANNTVFILTCSPWAGGTGGGATTFDPKTTYELKIDTDGDSTEDVTFEATFGDPDANGVQPFQLRRSRAALGGVVLARGSTGQNVAITGGGMFRAAVQDDPFFFDEVALNNLLNNAAGAMPRPVGTASNRFGPNANVLAITIEVPSATVATTNSLIRVIGRTEREGVQIDTAGRPLTSKFLIPPVPRGSNFPTATSPANRVERRLAFNLGLPRNEVLNFAADLRAVYQNFYGRTAGDATALAGLFLPDGIVFQVGNPNGYGTFVTSGTGQGGTFAGTVFGNGRRLRDDVVDIFVNLTTNGGISTDNVPDDNATRITDGNLGTVAAFPFIGAPNGSPAPAPSFP